MVIENGRIREFGDYPSLFRKTRELPVRWTHSNQVAVFPGLIDMHAHVAQYPAVARGQTELLPWLRQHIFPMEREFTGPKGRREAGAFFDELARNGTTTAMLYTAVYEDSCEAAFQAAALSGLRIIMGKTMMDVGSYGQAQPTKVVSISLHESERLCKTWHGANDGLIDYAVSPRFAVACSEKMMRGASWLAKQYGAYIQTHLAENIEECEKVRHQFPWAQDYTEVYEKCGLLGPRTVLGHCLHLAQREREVLAETQSRVAHCPTANLFLKSGILALDQMRATGLSIGLGSDVAAGPELNMWRVMRGAIESQKARSFYEKNVAIPTSSEALYLATQGAADALGKGRQIGSFEPGKEADLLVLDYSRLMPYSRVAGTPRVELCPEDILSLCIHRGGPEAVVETFVRGRSVYSSAA
ncbi:MAG: Amidohydrolase [Chthoniobacteraceae bacterium]|nr:Amidohydrolase [Chthoniobacteraceae bacterium]